MLCTCLPCITIWTGLLKARTIVWLNVKNCDECGIHPTCKLISYPVIVSWMLLEETSPIRSETKDFITHGLADIMILMFIWESLTPKINGYDPYMDQGGCYTCTEFVLELNLYMEFASKLAQFLSGKEIISYFQGYLLFKCPWKGRLGQKLLISLLTVCAEMWVTQGELTPNICLVLLLLGNTILCCLLIKIWIPLFPKL